MNSKNNFKIYVILIMILLYSSLNAQSNSLMPSGIAGCNRSYSQFLNQVPVVFRDNFSTNIPNTLLKDSIIYNDRIKLLPNNISFMENWLWSESGFVRKLGITSSLSTGVRKSELKLRRSMLSVHQIGGFLTLDMMIYSTYLRQKVVDGNGDLKNKLNTYSGISIGLYSATGLLAILSPPPIIRRNETSTITIHKTLAWIHFAGTIISPIVAAIIDNGSNHEFVKRYRLISSYIATAALATAFIVITF